MRNRLSARGYCLSILVSAVVLSVAFGLPVRADAVRGALTQRSSPEFHEPVTLATREGVLEVRLTARQGAVALDTAAKPVENFLLFEYELIRGTSSDGKMSGHGLYPAPTLQVFPGETLIVHLDNALSDLTVADYFSPEYTAAGKAAPLYPIQLKSSPVNLHVHGIHVSPKGNSDNVMVHIPAGMSNTYTYEIPKNMPQGAYWYHSHLHTLTGPQTYAGLAGLLSIGRTDGNLPLVTEKKIPIRNTTPAQRNSKPCSGCSHRLRLLNLSRSCLGKRYRNSSRRPSMPSSPMSAEGSAVATIRPFRFT
jgi:FtsP/CotA-like multicopper oxidase with cupredoxin domain